MDLETRSSRAPRKVLPDREIAYEVIQSGSSAVRKLPKSCLAASEHAGAAEHVNDRQLCEEKVEVTGDSTRNRAAHGKREINSFYAGTCADHNGRRHTLASNAQTVAPLVDVGTRCEHRPQSIRSRGKPEIVYLPLGSVVAVAISTSPEKAATGTDARGVRVPASITVPVTLPL